jgi:Flp pilus assembly protein TadB
VSIRTFYFIVAVAVFIAALIAIAAYYYRRAQRSTQRNWEQLLKRLSAVDRSSIAEVALDIIDESGQQRMDENSANLEPAQLWKLVGGLEGLEVLEANCAVLVDLAFYVQQWYPEALVVAEQLRLSTREIEWHVGRLKSAQQTGKLESAFPMYAQPAVAKYYLMTRRVLALYEEGNLAMLADLRKAL